MKKNSSVFNLAARGSFLKILALIVLTSIVQFALFAFAASRVSSWDEDSQSLQAVFKISQMPVAAVICLALICILLSLPWIDTFGSSPQLSLDRLNVKSRAAAFWITVYNICCFIIFWGAQLGTYLLSGLFYLKAMQAANPMTGIFFASWILAYFHVLLPSGDVLRLVLNLVLILLMSTAVTWAIFAKIDGPKNKSPKVSITVVILIYAIMDCGYFWGQRMLIFYIIVFSAISILYIILIRINCAKKEEPEKEIKAGRKSA